MIEPGINEEENDWLIHIPDSIEISEILGKMKAEKAPGIDRITVLFFGHFWEI